MAVVECKTEDDGTGIYNMKHVTRTITAVLLVLVLAASAEARYCRNPYCSMCNRIFGPMPGYTIVNGRVVRASMVRREQPAPKPESKSEQAPAVESTPQEIVELMLILAQPKSTDIVCDPGCGDARFLTTAVRKYGCRAIGAEMDRTHASIAVREVLAAEAQDRVLLLMGYSTKFSLGLCDVWMMYLVPETLEALKPQWEQARFVASYCHPLPGVDNRELRIGDHVIYWWSR